jgi:hypothetical protein
MRIRTRLLAAAAALLSMPAAAAANVQVTTQAPNSGPTLVGGEVAWAQYTTQDGPQIRVSPLGGPIRTLAIGTGGDPYYSGLFPLGSGDRFAFVRVDRKLVNSRYMVVNPLGTDIYTGPVDGPYDALVSCPGADGVSVALSQDRLVHAACDSRSVVVNDLNAPAGTQPVVIPQPRGTRVSFLRTAGNHVAAIRNFDDSRPTEVVVWDATTGAETIHLTPTTTPTSIVRSIDIGADGRLLLAEYDGRDDRLLWTSAAEPGRHEVGAPVPASLRRSGISTVRIQGDRVAVARSAGCELLDGYDVLAGGLDGDLRTLTGDDDETSTGGVIAFDGTRVAWASSRAGVFARDLEAEPAGTPAVPLGCRPPEDTSDELNGYARVRLPASVAAVGRRITVPVRCIFGNVSPRSVCAGTLRLQTRRRYPVRIRGKRRLRPRVLGQARFELQVGGGQVAVGLNRAGRRALRGSGRVRVRIGYRRADDDTGFDPQDSFTLTRG